MPTGKPVVSADVKKQILDRVKKGEAPITQIAKDHGIHESTIYNWLSRGAAAPPTAVQNPATHA